jgi:PAS domain S-box-containing protein
LTILVLGLFTVALVFVSGETYRQQALDTQRAALVDLARLKVDDLLLDLNNTSRDLGLAIQQDPQFRKLFKAGDTEALEAFLKNQFKQYFVTAGLLKLERLDVLDAHYNLISLSSRNGQYAGLGQFICPDLVMRTSKRIGTERLKTHSELCFASGYPYHAIIIPIGLQLQGYLQVTTDPAHSLIPLETALGMPLALSLPNGISLYRSADWVEWDQEAASLLTSFFLEARNGEPALTISLHSDIRPFYDQLERTRTLVMLIVSLVTIVAVIAARLIVGKIVLKPLEVQVQERTLELSNANTNLQAEITERKTAEVALRESEERYRDLFENTNDLIQSIAVDGSILYVNRAWRKTLNYNEEEVRGLSLFDVIHPESRDHCTRVFERVIAGERLDHVEFTLVTKDGSAITVEGSNSTIVKDGKPVGTRGIYRDVTERKRAEEEVRLHQAELAHVARLNTMGEMASGLAHEINQPLSSIVNYM